MLTSFKHSRRSSFTKGFTLIELIVVSAIIILITTFVLFQQSKFNSSTLLRSLTYSVALSVRQAQVYGTSVRESSLGSNQFTSGYGIYIPAAGASSADTYDIFADIDGNGNYDSGEELPVFKLGKGYFLSSLCAVRVGENTCTSPAPAQLVIFFRRPNPEACISDTNDGACAAGAPAVYSDAFIQIKSTGNTDTRAIRVSSTGQISVCQPNLAPPQC